MSVYGCNQSRNIEAIFSILSASSLCNGFVPSLSRQSSKLLTCGGKLVKLVMELLEVISRLVEQT